MTWPAMTNTRTSTDLCGYCKHKRSSHEEAGDNSEYQGSICITCAASKPPWVVEHEFGEAV